MGEREMRAECWWGNVRQRTRRRMKFIGMDLTKIQDWVTSSFCHGVNENFAFLGCYAALIGRQLPTFRDYL